MQNDKILRYLMVVECIMQYFSMNYALNPN